MHSRPGTPPAVARAAASVVDDVPVLDETPMPPTPAGAEAVDAERSLQRSLPLHHYFTVTSSLLFRYFTPLLHRYFTVASLLLHG